MSFKVLVVPEDPTNNGYILKPLVSRVLADCGKPNAKITVLPNPKATGYEHVKSLLVEQIIDRYCHFDLLLFLPDADGKNRSGEFERLEAQAKQKGVKLLCCAAVQEVEVWLLAGHLDKLSTSWQNIRSDVSVKKNIFTPFLAKHGDPRRTGGGRDLLMSATLQNYSGLLQRCPELAVLQERIKMIISESNP
ncbi:hypothetical protein L0337_21020 [candidate division KSB1 bacterium]|nr:hypothetical protein [candidate division KSB1 bacterium]